MVGIYKITNLINQKAYIGQSVDIKSRFTDHRSNAFNPNCREYEKLLYRAFRKYGIENFSFEILEICEIRELNEKEKYYVELYDTFYNGYNATLGGDYFLDNSGENHPRTKLTNDEVYYIRECYNQHKKQKDVYEEFKHLIGESGFKKIWNGNTWTDIHMDVYTKENKEYFLFQRNSHSENNSHAKLKEKDVYEIRLRKKNGEDCRTVWQDYPQLTYRSFQNLWYGYTWKQVIV